MQTLSRQLAESKDSLQFSNKSCEQLESRAEEMEKMNTSLRKMCLTQQTQLEQKTATLQDLEEKLDYVQKEYRQTKECYDSLELCRSCSRSTRRGGRSLSEDAVDHPIPSQREVELLQTVDELTEELRTANYHKQKYEKGLQEVLTENQTLVRNLEKTEADMSELQARLRAYEEVIEKQTLERSCSSPMFQHLSVSSTPTCSTVFQYAGSEDTSNPSSLKHSRTTDSLLGTSLFSELDSQYSDLRQHYEQLVQQCTCSAGLVHRNQLKLAAADSSADSLVTLPGVSSASSGAPFKDLFEEVFSTLKQTAAVADKLMQRKKQNSVM